MLSSMCVFGRVRVRIAVFDELFPPLLLARTAACNARADQMPQLRRDFITAGVRVRKGGQNTQVPQPMAPTVGIRGLIGKVPPSGGTSPTVPSLLVTIPLHLTPSRSPCFCVEAERPSGHTKPSAAAAEREGGGPWWDSGEGCPNKKKDPQGRGPLSPKCGGVQHPDDKSSSLGREWPALEEKLGLEQPIRMPNQVQELTGLGRSPRSDWHWLGVGERAGWGR